MPREAAVSLPDWIPLEAWEEFLKMRKKIKKPATEYAKKLLINKLAEFKAAGYLPQAVLDQSIMHSWQGLFPISEGRNGNGKTTKTTQQLIAEVLADDPEPA